MKKTLLVLFVILILIISAVAVIQFTKTAPANSIYAPKIIVLSPSQDESYNVSNVILNVTVQVFGHAIKWLNFSLDNQTPTPLTLYLVGNLSTNYNGTGSALLKDLPNGMHNLVIQGETVYYDTIYESVDFSVNANSQSSTPKATTTNPSA
jgi:hypothetical protein